MFGKDAHIAELSYTTKGPQPVIELAVPHGTSLESIIKALSLVSQINQSISPRGCQQCVSGSHLIIRERYEEVVRVDLETGSFIDAPTMG